MKRILTHQEFCYWLDNNFSWAPFFKITNLCNFCCAHCCERSGPNAEPTFIPLEDVNAIMEQFKYVKNTMPVAFISGGEPMMAYKYKAYYIPQIMKIIARAGFAVELKTNAGWVLDNNADVIFNDLTYMSFKFPKTFVSYHLSLDKFHPQSHKTTIEFLRWYYNNKTLSERANVHLFFDTPELVTNMFVDLDKEYNIQLDLQAKPSKECELVGANMFAGKNKYIKIEPYHGITKRGRAMDNDIATKDAPSVVQNFGTPGSTHAIAFDNNGMAYFDCAGDVVKTPYKNERGRIKKIEQIKKELFGMLYQKYISENSK